MFASSESAKGPGRRHGSPSLPLIVVPAYATARARSLFTVSARAMIASKNPATE